jgi:hypothetical protein
MIALTQWQVVKDTVTGRDIAWLQSVGADAVVVPMPEGEVLFSEYAAPHKFAGVLPVLYDGDGHIVYRVPRRFPSRVRIVRTEEADRLRPILFVNHNANEVEEYARLVERGADRPVEMRRDTPENLTLRARLEEGEALLVQESYDPAWRAYVGERVLPIRKDVMGFMLVEAPAGNHEVRMVFELPFENKVGRVVTVMSILIAAFLVSKKFLQRGD